MGTITVDVWGLFETVSGDEEQAAVHLMENPHQAIISEHMLFWRQELH